MSFEDIIYSKSDGIACVTINRPSRLNAFTTKTTYEICDAIHDASTDRTIGVVVLSGAGDRAFCSGGDVSWEAEGGLSNVITPRNDIYGAIWGCPKPVIARVNGYAIGGGQVLQLVCDLAIASENARFGQNGPRVGSYNPGWGISYLVRVVGERKARELWYLCRQYTAQQALSMGLVNAVVPADQLDHEVNMWCQEILALGPEALRGCKEQFQLETAVHLAQARAGSHTVEYVNQSGEAREGQMAFVEKRKPDFSKFRQ